ncbi:hypothetical protein TPA0910_00030 [Streptomyces hygroscopicus subsp. sporocinereus]|uniref:Glycosyl hydrolase family 38 C-terminal domain-containing protein n=1 Tax=Streptomyces hygroscopicus TaxID=1912 RepID=A0ABQ3TQF1_STRHY|nr:hypothetical protein TPA0910_00030 [Streptomyces hygroscopicus]
MTVDADGLLTSVLDLDASREVLVPGARGNLLQLHPTTPTTGTAWDIDRHYRRTHTDLTDAESVELIESGPLRATVRVIRSFGASRITQELTLAAGNRRLDIATEVDWQESEKVLKAAFPLDVHAQVSTAEIQFGHVGPCHPHQHQLGRGPVRDLRPPLAAGGRNPATGRRCSTTPPTATM